MEAIIRNVRDIESRERRMLEHVLGRQLRENQQVIIQVVTLGADPAGAASGTSSGKLPDWFNVYEGLSDEQIAEVEQIALRPLGCRVA